MRWHTEVKERVWDSYIWYGFSAQTLNYWKAWDIRLQAISSKEDLDHLASRQFQSPAVVRKRGSRLHFVTSATPSIHHSLSTPFLFPLCCLCLCHALYCVFSWVCLCGFFSFPFFLLVPSSDQPAAINPGHLLASLWTLRMHGYPLHTGTGTTTQ